MLTIDKLREYGADVDEGLARCMNMEDFYIGLVKKALADNRLPLLEQQIGEGEDSSCAERYVCKSVAFTADKTAQRNNGTASQQNGNRLFVSFS